MNNEPSQFCGPPTREGASLNVPLPQSATLSDMCVNGPIVYECLDSALRSQVHLLQRDAPPRGAQSSPPGGRGQESGCACSHVAREWTDESCVLGCVRELGVCETGWERMQRWGKMKKQPTTTKKDTKTSEEKRKLQQWGSQRFQEEILPLRGWSAKSLKEGTVDIRKSSSSPGFCFWFIKLVLIDTGQCYWQVWSSSALY